MTRAPSLKPTSQVRCERCSALLAVQSAGQVSIRRGGLEVVVTGRDTTMQIRCYRCGAPRTASAASRSVAQQ